MPQRMRHYPNQQMVQGGNLSTYSDSISGSNSNNQLLVASQINQMPPHQAQVLIIFFISLFKTFNVKYYAYFAAGADVS